MTRAYDEVCLSRASGSLGRMLDYAVYSLHYDISAMMDLFIASGDASLFERGDIKTIAGMSGIELAYDVLEQSGIAYDRTQPRYTKSLSAEYWCGYTLAQVQWASGSSFSRIMRQFPVQGFITTYTNSRLQFLEALPLNITDAERRNRLRTFSIEFVSDYVSEFTSSDGNSVDSSTRYGSKLKSLRIRRGLSQSGLSKAAGIPVRTIQQYEQGQKDLSKARAEYLISLARVLNCDPAQLISRF